MGSGLRRYAWSAVKIPQEAKDKLSRWFTEDEMDVHVIFCRWLPFGIGGIILGRVIIIKKFDLSPAGLGLLGHELVHVQQYKELGFWGFLKKYAWDLMSQDIPIASLPLEKPAYNLQREIIWELEEAA